MFPEDVVDLLAGLEHALARRANSTRGPDGDAPGDAEVANCQTMLLDTADRIEVHVRQNLPAGTPESDLLTIDARTDDDPDGLDMLPVSLEFELDLRDGDRDEGFIKITTWSGSAERVLLIPHLPDLCDDHIDSALRRAHVVVPAVRRTPEEEAALPVPEVNLPLGGSHGHRHFSLAVLAF